jgi:hypothetical protein
MLIFEVVFISGCRAVLHSYPRPIANCHAPIALQNKSYPGHFDTPFTMFCTTPDKLNAKPSFAGRVLVTTEYV